MKKLTDLILASLGLIILSPLFLIISILVRVKLGGPIFFFQKRPGKNGEIFDIIKFRTMTNERDAKGNLLPNEKRLTSFGKWLRSTSLDEIPELINVLKGDMSLVGPRPLLKEYIPYYSAYHMKRHEVKPGITGWAQINGRNTLSWKEKLDYDVWYVENQSFLLDLKILILTIWKVFRQEDITPEDSAFTMRFDDYMKHKEK